MIASAPAAGHDSWTMRLRAMIAASFAAAAIGCGTDEALRSVEPAGGGGAVSASFSVRESVEQLHVTRAKPGSELELRDPSGVLLQSVIADQLGSYVFRRLAPGAGYSVASQGELVGPLAVMSVGDSTPDPAFYQGQQLGAGVGYITTRDGTKLAVYVTLPGPIEAGPYPTIVTYSGYDPARPGEPIGDYEGLCDIFPVLCDAPADASALIAALMGYATVGVNMRGTGCSGGAYDFFETLQLLDGYDVIETVAAQPWVEHGHVGMTGLSYPGITQLFVAKTRPPHLAAITPLSVMGNTFTTLVPGGILNDGFALSWGQNVLDKADPYGQGWERARVEAGDQVCEENQLLHAQKVDIIEKALANPYYSADIGDPINPSVFVDEIDVPVFLAGSWQDEQTGPFFFPLLERFDSAPIARFTVYNGVHPDGFAPQVLGEWKSFLDFYVARKIPEIPGVVRPMAPLLFEQIFGAKLDIPPDRFGHHTSFAAALAEYESEPQVRVIFENGAGASTLGAPKGRFERAFESWPPPNAAWRLYLHPDGSLGPEPAASGPQSLAFTHDPEAGKRGILAPGAKLWDPLPAYDWPAPEPGKAIVVESAVLAAEVVMIGTASVDLFVSSTSDDADLEVSLSEVRADGKEMYVQSGWLRVSQRQLAADASELWPSHTHLEKDLAPLEPGGWVFARIGIPALSHVFRAGSRIRLVIDTPGDSRAEWRFRLKPYPAGARNFVAVSAEQPSSAVFPVVAQVEFAPEPPPCPSLRGQPCRDWVPYQNVPP
jgi:uncharacterized protein